MRQIYERGQGKCTQGRLKVVTSNVQFIPMVRHT